MHLNQTPTSYTLVTAFFRTTLCVLLCFYTGVKVHAQTYATIQRNGTTGGGLTVTVTVSNPDFAVNTTYTDSTRLLASSTLGSGTAYIQLIFASALPANTTVFVKYKSTAALLGGGLAAQAYTGSTSGSDGSTVATTVQDITAPDGTQYLAVSSTASFNAVRITLTSPVALGTNTADIFYAYVPAASTCHTPVGYNAATTGVSVGSITNPSYAIDGNVATYANFNFVLTVAGTLTQTIYFQTPTTTGDAVTLTLSVPPGVLSLSLFNSISITAYNGSSTVGTAISMNNVLSLDLLGLLANGTPYAVTIVPSGPIDHIAIVMANGTGLLSTLYLNEVSITPGKPTFTLPNDDTAYACSGSTATLTADTPGTGKELRWYSSQPASNTSVLFTGNPFTTGFNITADTTFWVAKAFTGCTASSERVPVKVLVKPLPAITFSSSLYICQQRTNAQLLYTSPVNSPSTYSLSWGAAGVTAGFQGVSNAVFPVSPIGITVPGNAPPQSYPGTLLLTGSNGCSKSYPIILTIQATPHPPPPVTTFQ